MLIGPLAFLLLAGVVVMFDPLMVMGKPDWSPAEQKPGIPAHTAVRAHRPPRPDVPRRAAATRPPASSRTPQNW